MGGNGSQIGQWSLTLALTMVTAGGAWLALDQITGTGQGDDSGPKVERQLRLFDPIVVPARPVANGHSACRARKID